METHSGKPVGQKRKSLTIAQKVEIIQKHSKGASNRKLCGEYDVGNSTISMIISRKADILKNYDELSKDRENNNRKRFRNWNLSILDKSLYNWVKQQRLVGAPISGVLLQDKAKVFYDKLRNENLIPENANFNASPGWLEKFKQRHGLRTIQVKGEKAFTDTEASEAFKKQFSQFLKDHDFDLNNVYNCDEFGLCFKSLPEKTLVLRSEGEAAGHKPLKERVTVLVCANATGNDRVPLLIIGKSKKPRCFTNVNPIPMEYRDQKNAWMTSAIFLDWYKNNFLEHVTKNKPNERFCLLLDGAPNHPSAPELNAIDERCFVTFLPPNVTSLIQPMDQGPISALKRRYKTGFLREILSCDSTNKEVTMKFVKSWNILDCMYVLFESWNALTTTTLANGWKKLFGSFHLQPDATTTENLQLLDIMNHIPGSTSFTSNDIDQWLLKDDVLPTFRTFDDEELLYLTAGKNLPIADESTVSSDEEEEIDENLEDKSTISLDNILVAARRILNWSRGRNEFNDQDRVSFAKLRDVVLDEVLRNN